MADLIYFINSSLDGYIADENGNFDWSEPSEDAHALFNDHQRSVGTSLIGRRMYETMRVWDTFDLDDLPEVQREFAERGGIPTKSSIQPPWTPCRNRGPAWSRRSTPKWYRP
ncbi:dihydrofolate reductase family protein [Haladaptatus sp. R4]|uniref:dihydrofolate reductase family protein n=1 Tax=Haladaptatus sp. R4 TaxID=1679489 RepID=UPI001CC02062|nr:dihydrofolate reductase family protein [Haladaptatus sp. R4]